MSLIQREIEKLEYAKELLQTNYGETDPPTVNSVTTHINSAIDTIKTLSAKVASESMYRSSQYYHGGWIPLEEGYPPFAEDVLLTVGTMQVVAYVDDRDARNNNYVWYNSFTGEKLGEGLDIKAWRPLPPLFEEENNVQIV